MADTDQPKETEDQELERYIAYREKILAWLEDKWVGEKLCPVCTKNDWLVGKPSDLPIREESASYPVVPIICNNCGFTRAFNSNLMGLRYPEKEERSEGDAGVPDAEPEADTT